MKNWKTTVTGLGIGAAYALLSGLQQGLHVREALIAVGLAVLGMLAKDADVTGVGQDATRHP